MKVWVLPPRSLKVRAATAILCRSEETGPRLLVVRTLVRSRIWPGQTRSGDQPQRTLTRSVRPDADDARDRQRRQLPLGRNRRPDRHRVDVVVVDVDRHAAVGLVVAAAVLVDPLVVRPGARRGTSGSAVSARPFQLAIQMSSGLA